MPLYTDSNYYYSGGSSQLYSPYYPGSASATPTSSGLYSPYTSTYNRAIGGSYVVPISTSRTSSYSSPHGLSSRYQPKLSTITETSSPLMGASRHTTLMPLTRINSPKYTSYSTASTVHAPKYIPPRPILINTADIDVSANRYRQRKEETLRQAQRATDYTSPQSSLKRKNSSELIKVEPQQEEQTKKQAQEPAKESSPEQHVNRSTIRRNRAVVRLSTIRSRSKDRNANKTKDEEVPEKKFKDLPKYEPPEDVPFKWREKLADDLAQIPTYPNKKTPGDVLREKYLIQDNKNDENYAAQCRAERLAAGLPKESMEEVIVEIDPLHHTVRRLSIPQCPTFHDICEDISSDKIDDDLNAGALRRRASIIQNQEQEILNELQKSASGTFQMITLERRGSHDSVDLEMPTGHKRHSKRSSKKGKKLRTKITAIVDIENAPVIATVIPETPEEFDPGKSPKPKFTVNVESVEEHHEIHKVFKLPKKKSIKKIPKVKEQALPEGFMSPLPKPQVSPKKKFIKPTAEVFTFDEKVQSETVNDQKPILQTSQSLDEGKKPAQAKILEKSNSLNVELKTPTTPKIEESKMELTPLSPKSPKELLKDEKKTLQTSMPVDSASKKSLEKVEMEVSTSDKTQESKIESGPLSPKSTTELSKAEKKTDSPKTLKTSMSVDSATKTATSKILEKSNSVNVEMKTPPATPKTPLNKKETSFPVPKSAQEEKQCSPKTLVNSNKTLGQSPLVGENLEEKKVLKTSQSLDNEPTKPSLGKTLQKSSSINVELKAPTTPSTPPILEEVIKEDTQEINEVDTPKTDSKSSHIAEKLEDKKILKSSQSLDNEPKLGLGKTLQKSNSINVELKTPKTPTTPTKVTLKEAIKEESQATEEVKPLIAKPKPIQKAILKSDSGEDFWAQIGSRETMYMNKRKKEIVEKQWQKREDLLEATGEEDVKNIEEIKTKITSQKIEALKKAEQDKQNSKGVVSRSNSNESALKKKSPVKGKEEKKAVEKEKPDDKPKTPVATLKDLKSGDTKIKPNDKLENAKTPVVTKMSKETSLSPTTTTTTTTATQNTSSPTEKTAATITTTTVAAISNSTTPPKIVGQQAKSPEQQEQAEQNKCYPTTQAKNNNNKNEIDINKMAKTNTENNAKEQLAKTFTLPKENTTITAAKAKAKATDETPTIAANVADSTTTKQAETKQINKTTELQTKNKAVTKTKTTDNGNKPLAAVAKTDKESPTTKSKAKTSPNAINADQFITKAPAKTIATSAITGTTTTTTAAATAKNATSPKNAPTTTKTTNKTDAAITIAVSAATNAIGTATATPADNKDKCKTNDNSNNTDKNNNNDNTTDTGGSNLSKFATVLNLAQCLQDVDADLADYLPSSAEISENEDYSDSDFDYSKIDGWDKLTPSMKKKVKQRHRKEKQAEQARFDPQKKVKIDTTRKLYVKEEAPRFPLVATPRPLWKREKIVYPVDDSDDESDSEESGSTEETEDSDECTTSEEYEDEVSPTASGDGKSGDGKSGSSTDPNKENPSIIRMSTCSNDSGFEGGTAPASPKKMLETSYTYSQFKNPDVLQPPATITTLDFRITQ
ncbi:hypothetical protein DOY81_005067 [Sarcophaga bullata]|nr:hypothetical protein DOY81_005067 [Sarcophaga bullata]